MTHPIHQLLSARLACIEAGIDTSSVWFYGDRTPEALEVIRQWAAEHADVVEVEECKVGVVVDHRKKFESIVCWYPKFDEPRARRDAEAAIAEARAAMDGVEPSGWRPSDREVQS